MKRSNTNTVYKKNIIKRRVDKRVEKRRDVDEGGGGVKIKRESRKNTKERTHKIEEKKKKKENSHKKQATNSKSKTKK